MSNLLKNNQPHRSNIITFAATITILLLAGCASTEITDRQRIVNEQLPKPGHIYVYDFIANPANVPKDSSLASTGQDTNPATPPTADEIKLGNQLGASIAAQLVQQFNTMGLTAEKGLPDTKFQVNDIIIRGYLMSVEEGDGFERVVVGFGAGGSGLQTFIEGYQMTARGLRKLGSAKLDSNGSKTPGASLGAASFLISDNPIGLIAGVGVKSYGEISGDNKVQGLANQTAQKIADQLKLRFQNQGWIPKDSE